MFKFFRDALRVEEIRKKLWYTFLMLIVVRLGSQLPTPGVNPEYVQAFFASQTGEAFNFFNALTGALPLRFMYVDGLSRMISALLARHLATKP